MFTFKFDEHCLNYFNDNDYNKAFIEHALTQFSMLLKAKQYLYMRDILEAFGADPSLAEPTLGWDKYYNHVEFYHDVKQLDDGSYEITLNPINFNNII